VIYIDDESLIGGKNPRQGGGLSLQEEPSNVIFTFDEYETASKLAADGKDGSQD